MGLFGSNNKEETRSKIEELKAKMQQGAPQQQQPPSQQQAWQEQNAPTQGWQPPREQPPTPQQQQQPASTTQAPTTTTSSSAPEKGILLELGEGMSLNLPIREKMRLEEFLRIADRVRELKKIDRS